MRIRRVISVVLASFLLLCLLGAEFAVPVAAEELIHRVRRGQTLYSIANMYGVTVEAIVEANNLRNPSRIYAGMLLRIPLADDLIVHTVRRGETLMGIALKYGVSSWSIAQLNGIRNPNIIYRGQRLVIPSTGPVTPPPPPEPTPVPAPTVGPTPSPQPEAPAVQEAVIIISPLPDAEIDSPVTVTGWGSGFENTLAVDILDESGTAIGQGSATINAEFGQYGPFMGTVEFTKPATAQLGRIQIYGISPRDGAIEHLASVTVRLKP
jgi:LysM repeat protein